MTHKVCIVKTIEHHPNGYQIMKESNGAFYHLFPGKLFTLEEARQICTANAFDVLAVGSIWECLSK